MAVPRKLASVGSAIIVKNSLRVMVASCQRHADRIAQKSCFFFEVIIFISLIRTWLSDSLSIFRGYVAVTCMNKIKD